MNILDKRFIYTPSHATDIRRLFAKVRLEQAIRRGNERTQHGNDRVPPVAGPTQRTDGEQT